MWKKITDGQIDSYKDKYAFKALTIVNHLYFIPA